MPDMCPVIYQSDRLPLEPCHSLEYGEIMKINVLVMTDFTQNICFSDIIIIIIIKSPILIGEINN